MVRLLRRERECRQLHKKPPARERPLQQLVRDYRHWSGPAELHHAWSGWQEHLRRVLGVPRRVWRRRNLLMIGPAAHPHERYYRLFLHLPWEPVKLGHNLRQHQWLYGPLARYLRLLDRVDRALQKPLLAHAYLALDERR